MADVLYSKAIEHDPKSFAVLGNRSMNRLNMGQFDEALEDAEAAIAVNETWAKGYFRKAQALGALDRFEDALKAIQRAIELAPEDKALVKEV